jgi:hypothetical protein
MLVLWVASPVDLWATEPVFRPLNWFVAEGASSVATAAPLPIDGDPDVLDHPIGLLSDDIHTGRYDLSATYDEVVRLKTGDYSGTRADGLRLTGRATVAVPQSPIALGVEVAYDRSRVSVPKPVSKGLGGRLDERRVPFKLAAAYAPHPSLRLGVGVSAPFAEGQLDRWVEVAQSLPQTGTTIAYRNGRRRFEMDLMLHSDSVSIGLPIRYQEKQSELTLSQRFGKTLQASYTWDWHKRSRHSARVVWRPTLALGVIWRVTEWNGNQVVPVEALDGDGIITGKARSRVNELGVRWQPNSRWEGVSSIRRGRFALDGNGRLDAGAFLSTIERLIAGTRILEYEANVQMTQYQAGVTRHGSGAWSWSLGFQYIDLFPKATLVHWTPPPLLPFGVLDLQTETITITRARLGVIGTGAHWRYRNGRITLAWAQMFPIAISETEEAAADGAAQAGGSSLSGLKNRGGTRLMLAWTRPI